MKLGRLALHPEETVQQVKKMTRRICGGKGTPGEKVDCRRSGLREKGDSDFSDVRISRGNGYCREDEYGNRYMQSAAYAALSSCLREQWVENH